MSDGSAVISKRAFHGKSVQLQQLCTAITDCHHSTPNWTESGRIVIRSENIKRGRISLKDVSYTDEATFQARISRSLPEPGDLIVTREAPMGEVGMIPEDVQCCLGQRLVLVKPNPSEIDRHYLLYAMQSEFVQKQIRASDETGSTVSNLRIPALKELLIPLLDRSEEIGAVLSVLDAKIDLNNRINAGLEALAKIIYDYWFVQFDFPDAHGRPYKSSGGAMVWNDTLKREIPEGWGSGSLDDLGQIVGGSTPSTANPDHFGKDMTPWITPKDLSNNKGNKFIARGETDVSEAGMRSASLTLYPAGTVLMSSRAPVGYLAIALNPVTTNQGFKSFVPSKGYGTSFVYYAVQRAIPTIIQYASGSTFVEISGGVLKSVNAVLPDKRIADAFCRRIESVVERQRLAEMENVELIRLRDWLLPLLMNGQVRVASSSDAASAPAPEPLAEPA